MTGLVMTKTKTQRGLLEPITHIRKPHSIKEETGLPAQRDAWYRYTWDRSLFLIYRRKELQSILGELDFNQQDIDGLEVVGRGQPFSAITVEDYTVFARPQESSSEDTYRLNFTVQPAPSEKAMLGVELSLRPRSPVSEPQAPRQENEALRDSRNRLGSQKTDTETKSPQKKGTMLEIMVEQSSDVQGAKTPWELDGLPTPEWNLCLEDFRKVTVAHGACVPARQ
uniref:MYCBP associated protein n=1 Tax=Prolemur simus TaxID=1328070 RepID=A0A8C8ZYQ9_PROSS